MGGRADNGYIGAAWVFTRSGGVWSQQGGKLVGTGAVGTANQGLSVSLSADGNTAIVGGYADNSSAGGAAWVFTRSGGVWSQQGAKLVGTGAVGIAQQGSSVSLSGDGNTAALGGLADNSSAGAVWVFTRSGSVWSQQGAKLVGTGFDSNFKAYQGTAVALSTDGNTMIEGGGHGGTWAFTRSGGVWSQLGTMLVGDTGLGQQGVSVGLSGDGRTAIEGGPGDNSYIGAAWIFVQLPGALAVSPGSPLNLHGPVGGPFASDMSGQFTLTNTGTQALNYSISPPNWLAVSPSSSGSLAGGASASVIVFPGPSALSTGAGNYSSSIMFNNTTNGSGNTSVVTNLLVNQPPGGRLDASFNGPAPVEGASPLQ